MERVRSGRGRDRGGSRAAGAAGSLALGLGVVVGTASVSAQERVVLPERDRALAPSSEPLFDVGGATGPAWSQFLELTGAAFGIDGTLYLLDEPAAAVVAVRPDGSRGGSIGGRGEGPGEYQAPIGIAALADGDVIVLDARKRAFLRYAADGTHRAELRGSFGPGVPTGPLRVTGAGDLVSLPLRMVTGRLGAAIVTGDGVRSAEGFLPLLRVVLDDDVRTEVLHNLELPARDDGWATSVMRVFVPEPSFAILPGGRVAVTRGEDYTIDILAPDGSVERTIERPIPARPTTDADRRAWSDARDAASQRPRTLGNSGAPPTGRPAPQPAFYPVIATIRRIDADPTGRLWVERSHPSDATRPGPIDLIASDGEYLGTLPARAGGIPAAFGPHGLAVSFVTGEFDVPIARVHRLGGLP